MSFKPATSGTRLLDFDGLSERGIRFSDTHIWRLVKAGEFPEPVKIGRRSHWVEAEIDEYINKKDREAAAGEMMTVLSLCDFTGNWSRPYRDAGYDVRQLDLKSGGNVRLFKALPYPVRGVLAAPPCTEFAGSGARWWAAKGENALLEGLSLVDACCRIILVHRPQWWVIENPVGRLNDYLGEPSYIFNPSDYGDPYTKKTCLWGRFNAPYKTPVEAVEGSKMHLMAPSPDRAAKRSETPRGFSLAFFEANP